MLKKSLCSAIHHAAYLIKISCIGLILLISSKVFAVNQCEFNLHTENMPDLTHLVLHDQITELLLPTGPSYFTLNCKLEQSSVLSFRNHDIDYSWQDIKGHSSPLTSNHITFLIPAGVYQAQLKITARHHYNPKFRLLTYSSFATVSQQYNLMMGLFYGLCIALALYVLIIGRNLGDVRFRLYSLYISCVSIFFLLQEGQLNLFLSDIPWLNSCPAMSIFASLVVFTAVIFITRLLDIHIRWKSLTHYLLILPSVILMVMALSLLLPLQDALIVWIVQAIAMMSLIIVTIAFCLVGYAMYLRLHTANLVFFALSLVLIAMICRVLLLEQYPFMSRYALLLSFAVESFLLAIATSERIKRINQNRITAEEEAVSDELCAVFNRRGWGNKAEELLKLHAEKGGYLSLLYIDLDQFKQVNDIFGHQVGDEVLKVTAKIIVNSARESDVVGRLGGDEFVVLSHFLIKNECEIVTNRIMQRLTNFEVRTSVGDKTINASVGSKIFESPPSNVSNMLKEGDNAMYQAKQKFHSI